MENTYTFQLKLLQEIIGVLNQLPAGQVRGLLNHIEQTCVEQDNARAEEAAQEKAKD